MTQKMVALIWEEEEEVMKEEKEVALLAVSWAGEMHFETTDLQRSEKKGPFA